MTGTDPLAAAAASPPSGTTIVVDEQARLEMYEAFKEVVGVGPATTLLASLPPHGADELATRRDLEQLEARLEAKLEATLHRELRDQQRNLFFGMLAAQAAYAALVIGLA